MINIIGLILMMAGILYFNQSRQGLIAAREESLRIQAQIMAAAVAAAATSDTGDIVLDPDLFIEQQLGNEAPAGTESYRDLDFLINPEKAGPMLQRLVANTTTRARIFDKNGQMVIDSRHFYGRGEILRFDLPPIKAPEESFIQKAWTKIYDWLFAHDYPLQKPYGLDNGKDFPEIRLALTGLPVQKKAVNDKNEIIIIVAVPIQRFRAVQGVLILSTQGGEIDDVLKSERRVIFLNFAVAAIIAVLLSLSLAGHIAEPIRRLSAAARKIRRGISARVEIPDFTSRRDEIGHLSGSLRDMTNALYSRIDAIESFAADVSHELKNPLTSLRSAVETLLYAKTPEQQARLIEIVNEDVARMDRLISDISDASRLDAELVRSRAKPVDMKQLLQTLVELNQHSAEKAGVSLIFKVSPSPRRRRRRKADGFTVLGHENRIGQVVHNLLSNAISFSSKGSQIIVDLRMDGEFVEFSVCDQGPGIPDDNLEKIFKRFYTDRPQAFFGKNSGLGLSISKQIIDAYSGSIKAENIRKDGKIIGARFTVKIPSNTEESTGAAER